MPTITKRHLKFMKQTFVVFILMISTTAFSNQDDSELRIKKSFIKTVHKVEKAVLKLNKKVTPKKATRIATLVAVEAKRHRQDPRLILSILNVESGFNQNAVSKTHDISIAQINPKKWTPSFFKEKTGADLDLKRLKKDEAYAISRMCFILDYLKANYGEKDRWWFARYHSATPKHKREYLRLLAANYKLLKYMDRDLLQEMPSLEDLEFINPTRDYSLASAGVSYE